jgi:hypothetical protein
VVGDKLVLTIPVAADADADKHNKTAQMAQIGFLTLLLR